MTSLTRTLLPAGLAALCVALPLGAQRDGTQGTTSTGFNNPGGDTRVSQITVADRQAGAIAGPIILLEGRTSTGEVLTRVRQTLVNGRGDVALEADLADGTIGIFSSRGGKFSVVAKSSNYFGRDGFALQSMDPVGAILFSTARGAYHVPAGGIEPVHLPGHNARVDFASQESDSLTVADASGLYRGEASSAPAPILRTGDRAPGVPDPIRFGGIAQIHESRGNQLIFSGKLEGVSENPALFLMGSNGVELAVRPGSFSKEGINEVIRARVNASGNVIVEGRTSAGTRLYYGTPGKLTLVDDTMLPLDGSVSLMNDGRFMAANNRRVAIGRPGSIAHHDLPQDVTSVHCFPESFVMVEHRPAGDMFIHTGLPSDLEIPVRSGDRVKTSDGKERTVSNREPRILSASHGHLVVELTLDRAAGDTKDPIGVFAINLSSSAAMGR